MTDLSEVPGLDETERDAVRAYEEAKRHHAAAAMSALLSHDVPEAERRAQEAVVLLEEAFAHLYRVAPEDTPERRPGAMGYGALLGKLQALTRNS